LAVIIVYLTSALAQGTLLIISY